MRRLIIRFLVAVITFAIGLTIFHFLTLPVPQPIPPVVATDPIMVIPTVTEIPDLPAEPNPAQGADLSIGVAIGEDEQDSPIYKLRYIKLAKHGPTIVKLDLGEYLDSSEVTLYFRDSSTSYRILQRYRTSMTISGEGPHIDLIDWRHFDSQWKLLNSSGPHSFRTVSADQMDVEFPRTSQADIFKEARRHIGNGWPGFWDFAKTCRGPNDGACSVGISSVYLKIQKQVRGRWSDAALLEFQIPMGC